MELTLYPSALCGLGQQLSWERGLPGVGAEDWREGGVKHSEETDARSSVSSLLQQIRPVGLKRPPPTDPLPWPRGPYTGTQWCLRRLEEFSQGTTRISKSQRSFCRQRGGGEGG